MSINEFFIWLGGGGCIIAASWLLGRFDWYIKLAENIKQLVFFGVALLFGGGAYAVTQYVPESTLMAIAPYFLIASMVFSYVFLNKLYNRVSYIYRISRLNEEKRK